MKISKLGLLALLGAADLVLICGGTGAAAIYHRESENRLEVQEADKYANYFLLSGAVGCAMIAPCAARFFYNDYRENKGKK